MAVADYSWDRPRPSELAKAYAGVVRYAPGREDAVHITKDEVDALRAAGLLVAVVIQPTKTWTLGGFDSGVTEAQRSVAMTDAAGLPPGDVFVAVDFDASSGPAPHTEATLAQLETIARTFEGVASVVGQDHVRPYGGYHFLAWLYGRLPWLKPAWQPRIAWSLGPDGQPLVHPNVALVQNSPSITFDGAAIDHNDVLLPDWGQRVEPTGDLVPIFDDTRSDWNARPPLRALTIVPWSDRIGVSWHWIGPGRGPSEAGSHQKCLDQVRDWQWQHQHKAPPDGPWKDIGYNALICQHARAIEGRGLTASGSHSPGVNYTHVGIQFMVGEDTGHPPTAAMLARAQRLRADIGNLGKNIRRDWSHRDDPVASTDCAGDWITKWVHTGGPTATTTTAGEDMPLTEADVNLIWAKQLAKPGSENTEMAASHISKANVYSWRNNNILLGLQTQVAGLSAAVEALAQSQALDPVATSALIERLVKERLDAIKVEVSVSDDTPPAV